MNKIRKTFASYFEKSICLKILLNVLLRLGGKTFGPRGPNSSFYMAPLFIRVLGLQVALSIKYAQVEHSLPILNIVLLCTLSRYQVGVCGQSLLL